MIIASRGLSGLSGVTRFSDEWELGGLVICGVGRFGDKWE